MNVLDRKVEEIWKKINEQRPQIMIDRIQCFGEIYREGIEKSKEKVKMTQKEYQTDPVIRLPRLIVASVISCLVLTVPGYLSPGQ